jgi:hypothetical protein
MYCPKPTKKTKSANTSTPATKTLNPPGERFESCGASSTTVVIGGAGTSTSTTISVPGPAGPPGPAGADGVIGKDGWGFKWEGEWAIGADYVAQSDTNPLASVVAHNGATYICTTDNNSASSVTPEHEPGVDTASWSLLAEKGTGALAGPDKDFFDSLKDDVFDWVKNASIGDLLQAGAIAAGVIWAGSKIISSMSSDGSGDGSADSKYNGSDSYLLTTYTAPDIKAVIASYCDVAGVAHDASLLPNSACEFTAGNQTSIRTILGTLALTYQFDMVDTGGVLKFIPRVATVVKTIPLEDLGFVDNQGNLQPPYSVKRFQGIDLPKTMTLTYPATDLDYNTFTQTAELFTYSTGQDVKLETPVTLTHAQAKEVVEVSLINAHLQRTQYRFVTSYKHMDLEPSDVVSLADVGLVRIRQLNEKTEALVEFIAEDAGAEQAVQGSGETAQTPPASTNVPTEIGYSQAFFIDPPNLDSQDVGVRMYAAVHGYDKAGWPGASVYVSENGGASYDLVGNTYKEATFGLVAVATPSKDYHVWDETTTISVVIKANDLTSVSAADVMAGKNRCMVGQEVIGFKNAVLTAPKTYTLSGLLRGRQGTEQYVGTHVANELFVLLDDAILRMDWLDNDRMTTKKYKVITIGSTLDKVTGEDVFMVSNNTLMWAPTNTKCQKIGSDFQVSYSARTRFDNDLKDFSTTNNDADWAGFGIQVMDGVTVKKSYTTTSETWVYTAAMQTADFGSVQSSLSVKVAQLSQKYGAGYPVSVNS